MATKPTIKHSIQIPKDDGAEFQAVIIDGKATYVKKGVQVEVSDEVYKVLMHKFKVEEENEEAYQERTKRLNNMSEEGALN